MVVAGVAVAALAAAAPASRAVVRDSRLLMGTLCEVRVHHATQAEARRAAAAALEAMAEVDHLLSLYDPASELSRLNRAAADGPVVVSPALFAFLMQCRRFVDATGGTFDPAVGALVRAWGFLDHRPAVPSPEAAAAARRRSGFDLVRLDPAARTVTYAIRGVEIDPGGIGKGYAADRAIETLRRAGVAAALVSAGDSTIAAIGQPPDRPAWRVAVSSPAGAARPVATVHLRNAALSTSGLHYRFVQVGPHRYGHVIDPRSGRPVDRVCQATVVAPTAGESEAFAKAALILERDELVARLGNRRDLHVLRLEGACGPDVTVWETPWSAAVFRRGGGE